MNIFKKISLFNKGLNAYKRINAILKENSGEAAEVKDIINCLKVDFERLVNKLPFLKNLRNEIVDEVKKIK